MHRSGTSILAKVLEKGGVFMGVMKDHNYEALHFLSLNQQTLEANGASWLEPLMPNEKNWKTLTAEELYAIHYQVNGRIQKLKLNISNPKWGFKDPRTTFTLPMWLSIFPKAKVIHLKRNAEDVALSLQKRNTIPGEVNDPRLNDLDFNRKLWKLYVDQAQSYKNQLGANYLEADYEDLIQLNENTISNIETFTACSLKTHFKNYIR